MAPCMNILSSGIVQTLGQISRYEVLQFNRSFGVWSVSGSFNCDIAPCNDQPSNVTCFFSEANGIRRNLLPWYWIMCLIHKYMSALWKILMIEGKFLKRNKRSFFCNALHPFRLAKHDVTVSRPIVVGLSWKSWRISKKNLRFFFFVFQNSVIFALGA